MKRIGVLAYHHTYNRGSNSDFYPVIKWKNEFREAGVEFTFFKSHSDRKLFEQDVVIIDSRYYRDLTVVRDKFPDNGFIKKLCLKLRNEDIKVLLFENGDGARSGVWDMIDSVDIVVKKQLFKDKKKYTENNGIYSIMPFVRAYNVEEEVVEKYNKENSYTPCPPGQLHKIRLGWNIGMSDYRYFPLKNYYPFNTDRFLNFMYPIPAFKQDLSDKDIDSTFRGSINTNNWKYSYQRKKTIGVFRGDEEHNFVTGPGISKRKYLNELKRSKTCVSPFGYGEVCYRDFESIICGCLLIKPDMDHIETYPDVYKKDETYVPLKWDMSDLEETLAEVVENFSDYIEYIKKSQELYKEAITDHQHFIEHFKKIIPIE